MEGCFYGIALMFVAVTTVKTIQGQETVDHCGPYLNFGPGTSDQVLPPVDDDCQQILSSSTLVPFAGEMWDDAYLCPNGLVCFGSPYTRYANLVDGVQVDPSVNCLVPYFEDHDPRNGGNLYYNIYESSTHTNNEATTVYTVVRNLVQDKYSINFQPTFVFKATWEDIQHFDDYFYYDDYHYQAGQHITFQVVYAASGTDWYAFTNNYEGRMLYDSSEPFIGMIQHGLVRGFSTNRDGTPLLRPDETLVYETNSGRCLGVMSFPGFMQPCEGTPPPCSHVTACAVEGYVCVCDIVGYHLDDDRITCVICDQGTYGPNCTENCQCSTNAISCDNVDGSCTCGEGWTGETCSEDIKECDDPAVHNCPVHSHCVELPGSFRCQCDDGYSDRGDGACEVCTGGFYGLNCNSTCDCVDAHTTDVCDHVNGSCLCKDTWSGDRCQLDVDECQLGVDDCLENAFCLNTPGGFVCPCVVGFERYGNDHCVPRINACRRKQLEQRNLS